MAEDALIQSSVRLNQRHGIEQVGGWGAGVLWDYPFYLELELLALRALLVLTEVQGLLVLSLPLGQGGLAVLQAAALLLRDQNQQHKEGVEYRTGKGNR